MYRGREREIEIEKEREREREREMLIKTYKNTQTYDYKLILNNLSYKL